MDLALIGNCAYQALIDDEATVRWLCWPRFDASFVFGSLLDVDRGGEMTCVPAEDGYQRSQAYLGLTNILRTTFERDGDAFEVIDFAPRFQLFERYYKPTMLIRIVRPLRGTPRVRVTCRPTYDYGRSELTRHLASNHIQWHLPEGLRLTTLIPLSYIDEGRPFLLDREQFMVLTWGEPLEAPLAETCRSYLDRTRRYWETWGKHINLPGCYEREVVRSALILKLHQFEETGAITAAATTSIPEYPGSGRNWDYRFCWLRDAYFTLNAMRRLNHFEEAEAFVAYLANIAENATERLQPVYGITGEAMLTEEILDHLRGYRGSGPVRIGNAAYEQVQHDVYGEMLAVLAPMFLDIRYESNRSVHHLELVRRLVGRIEATLQAPDAGLWEIRDEPKVHTFSLLMHWLGATTARSIGERVGDTALAEEGGALADRAREIIEDSCWNAEGGHYADATTTTHADAALMMMVNLGLLDPQSERAHSHVRKLAERLRAGPGLLHRYVHHDGIGQTHAAFTVCGFWHAEALARIGAKAEGHEVMRALIAHQNHVGLFSEDIDPKTGAQLGNFPQTYSHVGLINAAFALEPTPPRLM